MGILAGIITIMLSIYLRKKDYSKWITMIPMIILVVSGITMIFLGYLFIRGFEGFGYIQFGVANLLCSSVLYIVIIDKSRKLH